MHIRIKKIILLKKYNYKKFIKKIFFYVYIYINAEKVCYLSINLYKHLFFNKLQVTNFKKKYVT